MPLTYRFDKEDYLKLSDEVLDSILEAIKISKEITKEVGFYICGTKDENFPGEICIGTECSLKPKNCEHSRMIAFFHTHPMQEGTEPSILDILYSIEKHIAMCIYGTRGINVCCYKPKREAYANLNLRIPSKKVVKIWKRYLEWEKRFQKKILTWESIDEELREYEEMCKNLMEMVTTDCWKIKYVESKRDPLEMEI